MPHREDKHIRLIAVSGERRMSLLPDMPTIAEFLPNFSMTAWRGFVAPAGTPQPIIEKVSGLIQLASKDPAVAAEISNLGDQVLTTTPAQHATLIANEQKAYADAIAAAGLERE